MQGSSLCERHSAGLLAAEGFHVTQVLEGEFQPTALGDVVNHLRVEGARCSNLFRGKRRKVVAAKARASAEESSWLGNTDGGPL